MTCKHGYRKTGQVDVHGAVTGYRRGADGLLGQEGVCATRVAKGHAANMTSHQIPVRYSKGSTRSVTTLVATALGREDVQVCPEFGDPATRHLARTSISTYTTVAG